jgi:hypothetical protein
MKRRYLKSDVGDLIAQNRGCMAAEGPGFIGLVCVRSNDSHRAFRSSGRGSFGAVSGRLGGGFCCILG